MSHVSQYEKYWQQLHKTGELVIRLPAALVPLVKKAIIKRKYNHGLRYGVKLENLTTTEVEETYPNSDLLTGYSVLTFTLPKLDVTKDI